MIEATYITNIWTGRRRLETVATLEPMAVRDVIATIGLDPDAEQGAKWAVIHEGRRVELEHVIGRDDRIVLARVPAFEFIVYALVSALISFGISLLIDAILGGPEQPNTGDGATYGFGGIRNTRTQGTQIPAIFGRHRVGGQILMQYRRNVDAVDTTEHLYLLIGLGIGQLRAIGDYTDDSVQPLTAAGEFLETFADATSGQQLSTFPGWEQGPFETGDNDIVIRLGIDPRVQNETTDGLTRLTLWKDTVGLSATDVVVQHRPTLNSGSSHIGVALNAESWRNFHGVRATSTTNMRVFKMVEEVETVIANVGGTNTGQLYEFSRVGDTLELKRNGVSVGTWAADTGLTSNRVGICAVGAVGSDNRLEEFGAKTSNRLPAGMHINGNEANGYRDITGYIRLGRAGNAPLPAGSGFDRIINGYQPGLPIDVPWTTYSFRDEVEGYQLVIEWPGGLFLSNDQGLGVVVVEIEVEYRANEADPWQSVAGSPFVFIHDKTSAFTRTIFQDSGPALSGDSQQIRIRRRNAPREGNEGSLRDKCRLASVNEILGDTDNTYDDIAFVALRIEAQENLQGGTPTVTNIVEGLACPTWDGVTGGEDAPELVYQYSRNPAWVALGIILDPVYGLGVELADIDIASFYEWAQWNDEVLEYSEASDDPEFTTYHTEPVSAGATSIVVDGDGGQFAVGNAVRVAFERVNIIQAKTLLGGSRYQLDLLYPVQGTYAYGYALQRLTLLPAITDIRNEFNGVFDSEVSVWEAILRVCQTGRAMPVKEGRKWRIRYEEEGVVTQHISDANTVRGSLEISYAGTGDVPDIVEAQFLDAAQDWDQDVGTASGLASADPTRIPKRQTVTLYGVTGGPQARREANFRLRAQSLLSKRVKFRVTLDSIAVQSGDIIELGQTMPGWSIWSGRCRGTTQQIRIDSRLELPEGDVVAIIRNGSDRPGQSYNVVTPPRTLLAGETLVTNDGSPEDLVSDATVTLTKPGKRTTLWRVTRVSIRDDLTAEVEAVQYDPSVYLPPGIADPNPQPPPTSGCIAPGTYVINVTDEGLDCPQPSFCNDLEPNECCCFYGVCTIYFDGSASSCVEIIEIVGSIVIFRVLPGCESGTICLNVVCNGNWALFACCDDEGFGCDSADDHCASNLADTCGSVEQRCWTVCPSAFSSGFEGPAFE